MKRAPHALLALALLPLLLSAGRLPSPAPAPTVQSCHYEAQIAGIHTYANGATIAVPIGRIVVTACTSPQDLARQVEERTREVQQQATAQALR